MEGQRLEVPEGQQHDMSPTKKKKRKKRKRENSEKTKESDTIHEESLGKRPKTANAASLESAVEEGMLFQWLQHCTQKQTPIVVHVSKPELLDISLF